MKFIHLSDLHLGKRLNEFSMLEEQEHILSQILDIADECRPDGVLIAGDIYDKTVPPTEAVQLFDDFLYKLSLRSLEVFIISGNHDSPERVSFGARIMDRGGIHFSPVYGGKAEPFVLKDEYGCVNVYMLPFIKPSSVRRFFDEDIVTYTDAVRVAVDEMNIDENERNILIAHQFVGGALESGSEELSVGGSDMVSASVFEGFDYVALGHIHRAQNCTSEKIRYCGTPLKYSFSEISHKKTLTVVELAEKGKAISVKEIPLTPLHDVSEIKGSFDSLTDSVYYMENKKRNDYLRVILTDENDVPDAMARLRAIYKNVCYIDYDNTRTRFVSHIDNAHGAEQKSALELFCEFYQKQNNAEMSEEQTEYMKRLIEEIEEANV